MTHKYGYLPDKKDHRDHIGPLSIAELNVSLPASVSLRANLPPIYDQGQLGSCTANAASGALEYQQWRQGEKTGTPSRLFVYYNTRKLEGTVSYDAGASLRDTIKVINQTGACEETTWPYFISEFALTPSEAAYQEAGGYKALTYSRPIRSAYYLKACLAAKRPFIFGFTVYESFESSYTAQTGMVTYPDSSTESVLGGHAVCAVGYKTINNTLYFEVRNSWGTGWGDHGYCWFPSTILLDNTMSNDFWTIKTVE